jgi:oligopeptide transport system substrate-binding protein
MDSMSLGIKLYKGCMTLTLLIIGTVGCDQVWNNPHEADALEEKIGYSSFSEPPKTLDPAKSYSADEIRFTGQIYEPLLQYNYLKRPYTLVPLIATELPLVKYTDAQGGLLAAETTADQIAFSLYDLTLKSKIYYYPHPAFAKKQDGQFDYQSVKESELESIESLDEFPITSTRELIAEDYIYEIKRLADPRVSSPIYGLMSQYIVGMKEFHDQVLTLMKKNMPIDLRKLEISGVKSIDAHHLQIKLHGKYPQFSYWLAMPFFSPVPWEVDQFYSQPGMGEHNLTLGWFPVGTGPYYLAENNPNQRMVLRENPFYRDDFFPAFSDDPDDLTKGYLKDAGKKLPLIHTFIYSLEKESIPRWNKFLQGYYDSSAIGSDSFDQAIHIDTKGAPDLTPELKELGIQLQTVVSPSIFYMGFNMLDPVVGGNVEKNRKLRQAISAVIDFDEYIAIFDNGRGLAAQGPIPPGIFGYGEDKNPITHLTLIQAKQLLKEAGYPNGRDERTGQPLLLNYDVPSSSGPDDKARFDWMRKQFAKLGIELNVRGTEYNRFQEKMRTGGAQIFMWGWNADYPDPENFLFLLYGPNGKVKLGGENAANYANSEFDALFDQMKNSPNSEERRATIKRMIDIVRQDAPWVFGVFPKDYVLDHQWMSPVKLNVIANNTLKYVNLDAQRRDQLIKQWNKPRVWPIVLILGMFLLLLLPVFISFVRRERSAIKKGVK